MDFGMSNFSQFTSGAQGISLLSPKFFESTTWTAPLSGWAYFVAIGGGGSGGAQSSAGSNGRATGGGAGGVAIKKAYVTAGSNYTITIGAGGAPATNAAGNAGGATSVSGTGVSITANGGSGGAISTSAVTLNGGAGGTATGGDYNGTGGRGGNITVTTAGNRATGGGGCNIFGLAAGATRGGDLSTTSTSVTFGFATGGGGVGGRGGDLTGTNTGIGGGGTSAGGGVMGSAPDNAALWYPTIYYAGGYPSNETDQNFFGIQLWRSGFSTIGTLNMGAGGGGAAAYEAGTGANGNVQYGLAGSGGVVSAYTEFGFTAYSVQVVIGAGTGGVIRVNDPATSGRAGSGHVIIYYVGQ